MSQALSSLNTILLIFALISLFVGAFTICNTFSIIVGQRTRELALLRVVGASRRQVLRSVLTEAVIVGLVSSAALARAADRRRRRRRDRGDLADGG